MKIHYFQRYHQGEDVATANTMLLLSRLYQYSPDKFYLFLQSICAPNAVWDFNPELSFNLQVNAPNSRLDAVISQQVSRSRLRRNCRIGSRRDSSRII